MAVLSVLTVGAWEPCCTRCCRARGHWWCGASGPLERIDSGGMALPVTLGRHLVDPCGRLSAGVAPDPRTSQPPRPGIWAAEPAAARDADGADGGYFCYGP